MVGLQLPRVSLFRLRLRQIVRASPLALVGGNVELAAGEDKAIEIGIHSVGIKPSGSTMPLRAAALVSNFVLITATASLARLATYSRLPSAFTASATGSAPK